MIDQRLVGAIVRGDLSDYRIEAKDARFIVHQRVATPVHALLQTQPEAAGPRAKWILDRTAGESTIWSMFQVATANAVAEMLADAGIRALVYKGVALAAGGLGQWRGRESRDVDVIIDVADVERAHEVMVANGMTRWDGRDSAPSRLFRYHDIEVAYSGLPAYVDLHWRLDSPGYLDIPFSALWATRRRITGDSLDVWTIGRAESALVSAVHGTREDWQTLRQMLDASLQLANMPTDEWRHVTELAKTCGASKSLAVALAVAQACDVEELPAQAGDWAREVADELLAKWSAGIKPATAKSPADAMQRRIVRWRLAPRPSAALDSLVRSGVRQVLHKRSWTLMRQPPPAPHAGPPRSGPPTSPTPTGPPPSR